MTGPDKLSRVKDGTLSFMSVTFLENYTFLKKFLTRYFSERQDIEDVAQEAYLRAFIAEKHKDIEQPKAYLFRVAKNIALTKLTRKSRQITDYIEDLGSSVVLQSEITVEGEAEASETLGLYCEAVAALPEKCRQVFLLRKVYSLSHKEIAERMSLSASSVEKYLFKGVQACRAFVQDREGQTPGPQSPVCSREKTRGKAGAESWKGRQ